MLICLNCHRPVLFAPGGWVHREAAPDCSRLEVAWPPPGADDGDADAA